MNNFLVDSMKIVGALILVLVFITIISAVFLTLIWFSNELLGIVLLFFPYVILDKTQEIVGTIFVAFIIINILSRIKL